MFPSRLENSDKIKQKLVLVQLAYLIFLHQAFHLPVVVSTKWQWPLHLFHQKPSDLYLCGIW